MKRQIEYFMARILSVINILIPKRKNLIVFYDSMNKVLLDNTEAIYSYIAKNDKQNKYKKIVLLPKSNKKHNKIYCSLIFMRAKYVFYSFGDLRIKPSNKQIVINQWHGSPVKSIGKLTKYKDYKKEKIDNFTFLISSSKLFLEPLEKAFNCKKEKVKIIGQARNDYFYDSTQTNYFNTVLNGNSYNKTIIWMPTFRISEDKRFVDSLSINGETLLPIFSTASELEELNNYLKQKNVLVAIKIHGHASFREMVFSNIKYITNDDLIANETKLYSLIKDFDSLITDYSSVFTDYYLLNKPIGFTLDDYVSYEKERGFSIKNPKKYMAGFYINNINDYYKYISNLVENKDNYVMQRNSVKKIMNKYEKGNCERLCKLANISFEEK